MTTNSPILLGIAAMVLTACAMVGNGGAPQAMGLMPRAPANDMATDAALTCALTAVERGGSVILTGQVISAAPVSGSYDLRIRRGTSLSMDQGGEFSARAGQPQDLGMAELSGRAADYDTALTLTVAGRDVVCPLRRN